MDAFCCCKLKTGCVVFGYIQLIYLAILIAICFSYAQTSNYYAGIVLMWNIFTALLFIKGAACLVLLRGIVKKNHFLFLPWLTLQFIENIVYSFGIIVFICLTAIVSPLFMIGLFYVLIATILCWYMWTKHYSLYKNYQIMQKLNENQLEEVNNLNLV